MFKSYITLLMVLGTYPNNIYLPRWWLLNACHNCALGLHDGNHRIGLQGYFQANITLLSDFGIFQRLESLALHVY